MLSAGRTRALVKHEKFQKVSKEGSTSRRRHVRQKEGPVFEKLRGLFNEVPELDGVFGFGSTE